MISKLNSERSVTTSGPRRLAIAAQLFICSGMAAMAHPGHSLSDASARHLLTSPDHLAVLLLAGCGLLAGSWFAQKSVPRRALQCGGAALLAAFVVLWGLQS